MTTDLSIAVRLCKCFVCSVLNCLWLLTWVLWYSFVIVFVSSSELCAIADSSIAIHLWRSRLARFFLVHFTRTVSRWSFSTIDALGTVTHHCYLCKIHLLL